jgi:hypothetical protein
VRSIRPALVALAPVLAVALAGCGRPAVRALPSVAPVLRPPIPIGIGEDYPAESATRAAIRRDMAVLREAGIAHLRTSFGWDAIEPAPGRYDWRVPDMVIEEAGRAGIHVLPYVAYTPAWAARPGAGEPYARPPEDPARYGDFMRRAAARYAGRVASWELWNEPDNRQYWTGDAADFARLLAAGSRGVRAGDPRATVVLGGIAGDLSFLEALFAKEHAAPLVDAVNLHAYYETWNPDPLEHLPAYIGRAHGIVTSYGEGEPLWMAEVGSSSAPPAASRVSAWYRARYVDEHTPRFQADALARTITLLLATERISLITWYRLRDLPPGEPGIGDENNRSLGLLDAEGRPKPAFAALSFMSRIFSFPLRSIDDRVRIDRRIAANVEVHALRRDDGAVVVAAWLPTRAGAPDANGAGEDPRVETLDLLIPLDLRGAPHLYDATGAEDAAPIVERRGDGWTAVRGLAVRGGETAVLLLTPGR